MDMKKLCADADTVLELLYNTYYEHVCTDDTDEIKQAFDDLYNALFDKSLKEKDAVIDLVCNLCRLHQQSGFVDGVKIGMKLMGELKMSTYEIYVTISIILDINRIIWYN